MLLETARPDLVAARYAPRPPPLCRQVTGLHAVRLVYL